MTNKPMNPATYEVTRLVVHLAGVQLPDRDFTKRKISGLKMSDLRTSTIQTPLISIQDAAIETIQLLKEYKTKIDEDVRVVRELLQLNPYFANLQWVADAEERLEKCQRAKRKPGSSKWRYVLYPEVVMGLVSVLRVSGEAKSDRDAAKWLEISGIMSSAKVLRKLKQAKKDPRIKPMLSPPPDSWPDYTAEELVRMYETAITPEEGQTLKFKLQDDHFQYVDCQINVDQRRENVNNS
jgi:hypothetical protein